MMRLFRLWLGEKILPAPFKPYTDEELQQKYELWLMQRGPRMMDKMKEMMREKIASDLLAAEREAGDE